MTTSCSTASAPASTFALLWKLKLLDSSSCGGIHYVGTAGHTWMFRRDRHLTIYWLESLWTVSISCCTCCSQRPQAGQQLWAAMAALYKWMALVLFIAILEIQGKFFGSIFFIEPMNQGKIHAHAFQFENGRLFRRIEYTDALMYINNIILYRYSLKT